MAKDINGQFIEEITKNGQDLYNLALNLTLTEEIQNQWVYLYTARGNIGTGTAT